MGTFNLRGTTSDIFTVRYSPMWKLELSGGLTEHYLCSVLLLGISSQELAVCLAESLVRHHQIYDIDVLFF
jgi:hypothetical protein